MEGRPGMVNYRETRNSSTQKGASKTDIIRGRNLIQENKPSLLFLFIYCWWAGGAWAPLPEKGMVLVTKNECSSVVVEAIVAEVVLGVGQNCRMCT